MDEEVIGKFWSTSNALYTKKPSTNHSAELNLSFTTGCHFQAL